MIIGILAWSGALLSCLLSVPQLLHALRSDRLDGVSAATYWLVLGNAAVWAAWAILAGEYAAGVPSLVNGPAAVLIIHRLRRAHRPSPPPSQPAELITGRVTESSDHDVLHV
jgi:uncharacterized protein with PQ loop repeat